MSCCGVIIGMPVKEKRRIGQIILQPAYTRTLIDNPRTEGKRKLECPRKNLTPITEGASTIAIYAEAPKSPLWRESKHVNIMSVARFERQIRSGRPKEAG